MDDTHEFVLYRAWEGDALLYVGITVKPGQRLLAHSGQAIWWRRVTHMTFDHLSSMDRSEVLSIEAAAIREERPLFNHVANPRRTRQGRRATPAAISAGLPKPLQDIHSARATLAQLDEELPGLVREAFAKNHTWQQIAKVLGVSKARVYQIRDGRR